MKLVHRPGMPIRLLVPAAVLIPVLSGQRAAKRRIRQMLVTSGESTASPGAGEKHGHS
jgi:hypothetical protein